MFGAFNDKKVVPEFSEEFKDNFLSHHVFFSKGKTEVGYDELICFFEIKNKKKKNFWSFGKIERNFGKKIEIQKIN